MCKKRLPFQPSTLSPSQKERLAAEAQKFFGDITTSEIVEIFSGVRIEQSTVLSENQKYICLELIRFLSAAERLCISAPPSPPGPRNVHLTQ